MKDPFWRPLDHTARDNKEIAYAALEKAKVGLALAYEAAKTRGDSSQLGYWSEQVEAWQHQINQLQPPKVR